MQIYTKAESDNLGLQGVEELKEQRGFPTYTDT